MTRKQVEAYLSKMREGSKRRKILEHLLHGRRITQATGLWFANTTAAQQRLGEMRRDGVPIDAQWNKSHEYKVYRLKLKK